MAADLIYGGAEVMVKALGVTGFIESKSLDEEGIKYHVVYYWNGDRKKAGMRRREIEPLDDSDRYTITDKGRAMLKEGK